MMESCLQIRLKPRFVFPEGVQILLEGTELLLDLDELLRIVDDCPDLLLVPDEAIVVHEPFDVSLGEPRDLDRRETCERLLEVGPLLLHNSPVETCREYRLVHSSEIIRIVLRWCDIGGMGHRRENGGSSIYAWFLFKGLDPASWDKK